MRRLRAQNWTAAILVAVLALAIVPVQHPSQARRAQSPAAAGTNVHTLVLYSHALGEETRVNVLLPSEYAHSTRRYPVLYLLHGFAGSQASWLAGTDVGTFMRTVPLIVVMPDGGNGWYTNAIAGGPRWESYHIGELIPYIDGHYRTIAKRQGRAIAGLSMGGFGAFSYAARHPDLFVAAASFSGVLNITDLRGAAGYDLDRAFGTSSVWPWRAHNPVDLATNLRGITLYLSSGNGHPGPLDAPGSEVIDGIETALYPGFQRMIDTLHAAKIAATVHDYGPGSHSWPYWQRELHRALPIIMSTLAHPPAPPVPWSYRTAEQHATVWGYSIARRPPHTVGFLSLSDVTRRGLTITGSGDVSLSMAPLYLPGRRYELRWDGKSIGVSRADGAGRLQLVVALGATVTQHTLAIIPRH